MTVVLFIIIVTSPIYIAAVTSWNESSQLKTIEIKFIALTILNDSCVVSPLSKEIPDRVILNRQNLVPLNVDYPPLGIFNNTFFKVNLGHSHNGFYSSKSMIKATDPPIFSKRNNNTSVIVDDPVLKQIILNDINLSVVVDSSHLVSCFRLQM